MRRCRAFGFPIEQVRSLIALTEDQDRSRTEARSIAQVHLDAVRRKLAELKGLERNLTDFIKLRCDLLRRPRARLRDPQGHGETRA